MWEQNHIKSGNLGRAGLEAHGRAGLRRRPCEARKK
jgi:hypothetical protein